MDPRVTARVFVWCWGALCCVVLAAGLIRQWNLVSVVCGNPCVNPQLGPAAAETLSAAGISMPMYASLAVAASATFAVATIAMGALVARRGTARAALVVPIVLFSIAAITGVSPATGTTVQDWLSRLMSTVALAGMFWLFAAFPTIWLSPRWLAVPVSAAAIWAIAINWLSPLREAIQAEQTPWVPLEGLVFAASILAIAVGQVVRYRRADTVIRRQLRVVLIAVFIFGLMAGSGAIITADAATAGAGTLPGAALFYVGGAGVALVLASMAVSLLRYRALVFESVLSAALVAAVATVGFALVYGLTVTVLSLFLDGVLPRTVAVFIAAVALALCLPTAARKLSGQVRGSDHPADLTASLSKMLVTATESTRVLPDMALIIAERLRLPAVVITPWLASPAIAPGDDRNVTRLALVRDDVRFGDVVVHHRTGQLALTRRERRALLAASDPMIAGLALVRLTTELAESRSALAAVREEERKALRQALHDEVVPSLAVVRHRVSAAKTGGPRSLEHLEQAESTIDSAISQLRSLARSLRPPVLDDRGLAGAIQQFADSMRTPVEVHARVEHPLTAIVELVAYRIAIEALVNAERHADATLIGVDITTHPTGLALDVVDNGVGMRAAPAAGVGLVTMRDRAAEVGGRCDLVPSDPQGTHVRLRIPSITALTR